MAICYIGNIASHYRASIFSKMCKELSCDFYVGQPFGIISNIKTLPLSFFTTHAEMLQNVQIPFVGGYWQKGSIGLLKKGYDIYIVVGELTCFSTWFLLIVNFLFFHKKIVLWGHGWYGRESFLKKIIKKFYYSLSNRILVYGDRAKHLMEAEGIDPNKIYAVHNSLDYDKQQETLKHLPQNNLIQEHFKNKCPTIVFSGRLTAIKQIDMIIKVLSLLAAEGVTVNCVLIGDGPEQQNLEALAVRYGLRDQVWFYGACYDETTIGSMYWNAAACVSPGNVGLTAIHALTYGCPVITHNDFFHQMPEYEVIIPDRTGDFFEIGNCNSLKDAVKKWVVLSDKNRSGIRRECMASIQKGWTPDYQIQVIKECCSF